MPEKINSVIVDDEDLAREALKKILAEHSDIEIAGEYKNGFELIKEINKVKPDLILLDIQMPKLNGFDVVELLGKDSPFIIFVSAYDEFAIKAFETHALDYLMKPVSAERLSQALQRVRDKIKLKIPQKIIDMIDSPVTQSHVSRIMIRDGHEVIIIPAEKIMYIEAADDQVIVNTPEASYIKPARMNKLERILDPSIFCRIHKSYILNVNYLKTIETYSKDDKIAVLTDKKTIPISRSGYKELMKLF